MASVLMKMIEEQVGLFSNSLKPIIEKAGIKLNKDQKDIFLQEATIIHLWATSQPLGGYKKTLDELHAMFLKDGEIKNKLLKRYEEYYKYFNSKKLSDLAFAMWHNLLDSRTTKNIIKYVPYLLTYNIISYLADFMEMVSKLITEKHLEIIEK